MSAFEYITVLISIILGLGITQILTGIADLIKKSNKISLYWPHLLWIVFILLLHIQEWWLIYDLKQYQPWRLSYFLFIMIYPVNLFVLARLLFPARLKGKKADLKYYYFSNYRKIFAVLTLSAIVSVLYNVLIMNMMIWEQAPQMLLALAIGIIAVKNNNSELVHKAISLIVITGLVISIIVEWNVWLIA